MTQNELLDNYGPVALVTGASSGIGKAFAELLAANGLNLLLVARRLSQLEELASRLRKKYAIDVTVCQTDLSSLAAVQNIVEVARGLDVGLVVSNAGFSLKGQYAELDAQLMSAMLTVNCHIPMLLAHSFVPQLQARGKGGIIFTSSVESLMGCPFSTAYSATKSFVKNLGEGLWGELVSEGIDVLTICPGATATEGLARSGLDAATMENVMSAEEVATLSLQNIKNGPVYICSEHYKALFEKLAAMPRREALLAMAKSMHP